MAWIGCKATIENDRPCECWNLDHIYWPIMRWTWWQQHVFVADTTSLVEKRSMAVDVRIPVPFYGLGTTIYFNPRTLSGRYMWSQCATCKECFRSSLQSLDTDLDLTGKRICPWLKLPQFRAFFLLGQLFSQPSAILGYRLDPMVLTHHLSSRLRRDTRRLQRQISSLAVAGEDSR